MYFISFVVLFHRMEPGTFALDAFSFYAGVDPKTVQYLAGHENSKTTMDIYAQVKYNKPEELVGVVNTAFHQRMGVSEPPF